jgi:hypothetical protein
MGSTLPNKVTIDGVPRYVAYVMRYNRPLHFECQACGAHFTVDKPYYYTADDGERVPLCHACVRGDTADPRFIWWRLTEATP